MQNKLVKCGKLSISNSKPFILIAGPCQLENEKHALEVASKLKDMTQKFNIGLIYKTSFDRSEEHTSELQSLVNLVCRLLLEKKK